MKLFELFKRQKPIDQQRSSLTAAVVSQLQRAAARSNLAIVCETYFVTAASEARFNHEWLDSNLQTIARHYITTGAVVIHRLANGELEVLPHGSDRGFVVNNVGGRLVVFVNSSALTDYEVITWAARALDEIVSPREVVKDELAIDKIVRDYVQTTIASDEYFRRALIPESSIVLTRESLSELRASLLAAHWETKGGTMILPANFEVQSFEPILDALNFEKIAIAVESRTAAVYGIPTILLGLQSSAVHSTYANYEQARLSFTHNVLVPFWQAVAGAAARLMNEEIELDKDSVHVLQESAVQSTIALFERGVISHDEARERLGYEPLSSERQQMIEQESEELWYQRVQGSYSLLEQRLTAAMRAELSKIINELNDVGVVQREIILRTVGERVTQRLKHAASSTTRSIVRDAFNEARAKNDRFVADPVEKVLESADSIIAEIIDRDMSYTASTLYDKLSQAAELDLAHIALVARTLATTIVARLQYETWLTMNRLFKGTQRKIKKYWISQRDERVRNHHKEADGQIVELDGEFKLKKDDGSVELCDHPGDPRLSPANRINCRCVLRPRRN